MDEDVRACGAWYRAGGCILPRRHEGQHRNQTQMETDRLRAENARLRAALIEIERSAARWAKISLIEGEARIHQMHADMARAALSAPVAEEREVEG